MRMRCSGKITARLHRILDPYTRPVNADVISYLVHRAATCVAYAGSGQFSCILFHKFIDRFCVQIPHVQFNGLFHPFLRRTAQIPHLDSLFFESDTPQIKRPTAAFSAILIFDKKQFKGIFSGQSVKKYLSKKEIIELQTEMVTHQRLSLRGNIIHQIIH